MKRYIVMFDAFIYAESDEDALAIARSFTKQDAYRVERLDVTSMHRSEFGELTTTKIM
jgi:hypothetical protein